MKCLGLFSGQIISISLLKIEPGPKKRPECSQSAKIKLDANACLSNGGLFEPKHFPVNLSAHKYLPPAFHTFNLKVVDEVI